MLGSKIFVLGGGGGLVQGRLLENSLNNVFFFSFSSAYLEFSEGVRLFITGFISEEITFPRFQGEFHH